LDAGLSPFIADFRPAFAEEKWDSHNCGHHSCKRQGFHVNPPCLLKTNGHFPVESAVEFQIAPTLDFKLLAEYDSDQLALVPRQGEKPVADLHFRFAS
jgi:hypothetical protein